MPITSLPTAIDSDTRPATGLHALSGRSGRIPAALHRVALAAVIMLGCLGGAVSHAGTINEYTAASAWAAISGATIVGTETFGAFSGPYDSPVSGTTGALAGGVVWSATAGGGLYVGNTGGNRAFSTSLAVPLTFSYSYGPGVSGVGGSFYPTDINFNFVSAATDVTVTLLDSTSQAFSRTISSASDFWGFHSTGAAIASITISVPTSPVALYATVSNMSLMTGGGTSGVPEIDPAGFAGCFTLVIGSLAANERRVRRV